jgi:hypothetical protein
MKVVHSDVMVNPGVGGEGQFVAIVNRAETGAVDAGS